jgi:sporulation protein YlmC with PRC-barrel domain
MVLKRVPGINSNTYEYLSELLYLIRVVQSRGKGKFMENLVLSSSTLVGSDVKNLRGEDLGSVKDIMIDTKTGKVSYLVVAFGGFMGIGDKYIAVPMEAISFDPGNSKIILLDENKDRLENAPGFNKETWPDHPQKEFIDEVYQFFGYGKSKRADRSSDIDEDALNRYSGRNTSFRDNSF